MIAPIWLASWPPAAASLSPSAPLAFAPTSSDSSADERVDDAFGDPADPPEVHDGGVLAGERLGTLDADIGVDGLVADG